MFNLPRSKLCNFIVTFASLHIFNLYFFFLPSWCRLSLESVKDLEDYIRRFFKSLPRTAIICVSVLGGVDSSLLQELFPSSARAWMLLSRLNSEDQPIILLQPLDPILEGTKENWLLLQPTGFNFQNISENNVE